MNATKILMLVMLMRVSVTGLTQDFIFKWETASTNAMTSMCRFTANENDKTKSPAVENTHTTIFYVNPNACGASEVKINGKKIELGRTYQPFSACKFTIDTNNSKFEDGVVNIVASCNGRSLDLGGPYRLLRVI